MKFVVTDINVKMQMNATIYILSNNVITESGYNLLFLAVLLFLVSLL